MIEGKDDARKRGVKSPDRAEALMLAFTPVFESTIIVDTWEENRREDQSLLTITRAVNRAGTFVTPDRGKVVSVCS